MVTSASWTLVRPADADAETIARWSGSEREAEQWCSTPVHPFPAPVVSGWWARDDVHPWLLVDPGGSPVAYGEVWDDAEEDEVELARLIVDPRRRGQGTGAELVGRLLEIAHTLGRSACFVRVAPGNERALRVYLRCGFRELDAATSEEWNEGQPTQYRWLQHTRPVDTARAGAYAAAAASDKGAEHEAGVRASLAWYEDVFTVHRIPCRSDDALWWAVAEPPPWHSAAKTLRPDVSTDRVLRAVEPFEHCSVADSYGSLDLAPAGFERLFTAAWLFRSAPTAPSPPTATLPEGWGVVTTVDALARWNERHDYAGVLLPAFLEHPRFTVLAHHDGEDLVGGAVLHDAGSVVELSNVWAAGRVEDAGAIVASAAVLRPGRPLVGYAQGAELDSWLGAGFAATGTQIVWVR